MILFVDTTQTPGAILALGTRQEISVSHAVKNFHTHRDVLLGAVDTFLKKHKASLHSLTGIIVVAGPGAFSAIRSGVILANTFGYALGIPVAGVIRTEDESTVALYAKGVEEMRKKKKFSPVMPAYGREPNISVAKPLL